MSGATGCGAENETGEALATETARLVSLPPFVLRLPGGVSSQRLGTFLQDSNDVYFDWLGIACPSGNCNYTVYRRVRTGLSGTVSTTVAASFSAPSGTKGQVVVDMSVTGGSRFEYWVVANDAADASITSPASNTITLTRCQTLYPDEYLYVDSPIYSCDAANRLYPQADGNLVLSKYNSTSKDYTTLLWKTGAKSGANRLYMQADGNLVYSAQPSNVSKWSTQTNSTPTRNNQWAELWAVADLMGVYKTDHTLLWRSDSGRAY